MTILNEGQAVVEGKSPSSRRNVWMLEQMAEALEDEASGLSRRAAAFEEEECLLSNEIAERETEVNRLMLKVESLHSERDSLLERIESLKGEANAIREEVFTCEEEAALAVIDDLNFESEMVASHQPFKAPVTRPLTAA